nr:MAG TPA: hypothetical protein [Caudoviricetes sp.]
MAIHNVVPPFISFFCFVYNRNTEGVYCPSNTCSATDYIFNYILSGSLTLTFWISMPPRYFYYIIISYFYNSEHRF